MIADAISRAASDVLVQGMDTGGTDKSSSAKYLRKNSTEASRPVSLTTQQAGRVGRSQLGRPQFASLGAKENHSAKEAYANASNAQQAQYFRLGDPVDGNLHQRRVQFSDGSTLTVKAHVPGLSHSDDQGAHTGFKAIGAGLLAAASAAAGVLTGGAATAAAVAATAVAKGGAALLTDLTKERPKDAAWQGYTCEYADPQGQSVGTRYMYAWVRSPSIGEQVSVYGSSEPNRWPDLALDPQFDSNWWTWRAGQANLRTSETT